MRQNSQKPTSLMTSLPKKHVWTLSPIQTVLCELEVYCTKILQLPRHRYRNNLSNAVYNVQVWLTK